MKKGIPIWIRNTFNPACRGTKIHFESQSDRPVKGFSAIDGMALINIEGTGMAGVPGIAERLFSSMSRAGVSVVMISQVGSEHSICFAIPQAQAVLAKEAVERAFYAEIDQGFIEKIEVANDCSILAIVGDNMAHHAGLAGRFFRALGQADVNVKAIAQGSSERNISAVIEQNDSPRALRAVHSAFYLSDQTLSIGIIGTGLIGSTLIDQLHARHELLRESRQIDLRIRGIMNSKKMLLADGQIDLSHWNSNLKEKGQAPDLDQFVRHLKSGHLPHTVIIDATASGEISEKYSQWLAKDFNIISPNKKANTTSQKYYEELKSVARERQKHFIYSTNVGAGLPIIQALRDLIQTGDKILSIEGVLSGTLSFIFNKYDGQNSFSDVVKEAKRLGYTEPDARDDLSGLDVARKLVILAREMGLKQELGDVEIESLVPDDLRKIESGQFLDELPKYDQIMEKKFREAKSNNEVLRYVGTIDNSGKTRVQLKRYSVNHAFTRISGSDNIVAFRSARYDTQPLVIQGPGAGPDVTAAGVFADILRLASYLGARF